MTKYITRAYNSFSFDFRKSTIKKHSSEQRLAQETEYYKQLPSQLGIYFPRLVSSGFVDDSKQYFLELELYPYENLGKLLIEGKLMPAQWAEIARHLSEILVEFSQVAQNSNLIADMQAMYFDKTEIEYKKLALDFGLFETICSQKTLKINGQEYENFEIIWPKIKDKYLGKLLDDQVTPSVIHGDFCFSNILVGFLPDNKTILRFIDPRGKFGSLTNFGDPYYDLAKLMHSTDIGYEYFIYDKFKVTQKDNKNFTLTYSNANKEIVNKIFFEHLYSKFDVVRIKLIQATIYIGMCARHYDSEKRQLAMYLSGVRLLNELIQVE